MRRAGVWIILMAMGCESAPPAEEGKADDKAVVQQAEKVAPPEEAPKEADVVEEEATPKEDLKERLELPEDAKVAPKDAQVTKSKIKWVSLGEGDGTASPTGDDVLWVHYVAWDREGARKGNTVKKNKPKQLKLSKALIGWAEMLKGMSVGERRRIWIPAKLAHPKRSKVKDPADMRILDLQLVKLNRAPKAPKDVKRAPKDAESLKSGLKWKALSEAKGEERASTKSEVVVKYAGWTTKGKCFDFTGEGETSSFRLDQVIPGWTQGIRLLAPGQKGRFWIPEDLAYKGARGKPKGMLVFDVELLEIR